jgi:hypothetical protein
VAVERRDLAGTGLAASRLGLADSYGVDAAGVERAYYQHGINYVFTTSRSKACAEGVRRLVRAGRVAPAPFDRPAEPPAGADLVVRRRSKRGRSLRPSALAFGPRGRFG